MKKRREVVLVVIFFALMIIPYIIAGVSNRPDFVFSGFILNPMDGNSYLAKMYHGFYGDWKLYLPYTSDPGEGAYLQVYYLFLGHLARWTHIPMILVFHMARLLGAGALLVALRSFYRRVIPDPAVSWTAYVLALFGSGMGWLALPFMSLASDFWVAEAYPFLSAFSNAHFGFTLALMVYLLSGIDREPTRRKMLLSTGASLALAAISPFGAVVVLSVTGGYAVWRYYEKRELRWQWMTFIAIGSMPVMGYQYWVAAKDPVLSVWNRQNLLQSPALWDLLLSFMPAIILAGIGGYAVFKCQPRSGKLLAVWVVVATILIYVPVNIQRRFMTGLFIPMAGLASIGFYSIKEWHPGKYGWVGKALLALSVPTNLILIITALLMIPVTSPEIYLRATEDQALTWIRENTNENALILASPSMGTYIPAWTGRRVIYGHPVETIYADKERESVKAFFDGEMDYNESRAFLEERKIDYIIFGPREAVYGNPGILSTIPIVYKNIDITIYSIKPRQ